MKKHILKIISILLFFSVVACTPTKEAVVEKERNKAFDEFCDSLAPQLVADNDYALNYLLIDKEAYGFNETTYTLSIPTYEEWIADNKMLETFNEKLLAFDIEDLNDEQQLTYEVLQDALDTQSAIPDKELYYLSTDYLDATYGIQSDFPLSLYMYTFRTKQDIDSYINLMKEYPAHLQSLLVHEQERQDQGFGMTKSEVAVIKQQAEDFLEADLDFLVSSFKERIDSVEDISEEEKKQYEKDNETYLKNGLVKGYEILRDDISNLDIKNTQELGISAQEYGKEYYEALIAQQTGYKDIKDYLDFLYDLQDDLEDDLVEKEINIFDIEESEVSYTDKKTPKAVLKNLEKMMEKDFPKLDSALKYTMEIVPEGMQSIFSASAAYYISPIDKETSNERMILNKEFDQNEFLTIAHEGYPGHMYQTQYYQQMVPHHYVRDFLSYSGYSEGYANYVQRYATKYANDVESAEKAQAIEVYIYIGTLILDFKIHYEGLDIESYVDELISIYATLYGDLSAYGIDVTELLKESISVENTEITDSYNQLLHTPAIFPKYYAAGFQISQLREENKAYTDVEFHEALLHVGDSPYPVMKKYVEKYLQQNFD
ncbi:MAG: DUF885 family protein [Breznakia sp.]